MIKAMGSSGGRKVLILGLSHDNLDRLRADGLNGHILIAGAEIELPFDIHITAAATEDAIVRALMPGVGPQTTVHVSDRVRDQILGLSQALRGARDD
jgi:hypothetical protein